MEEEFSVNDKALEKADADFGDLAKCLRLLALGDVIEELRRCKR